MKRLGTILLACALILGMSQCKKENTNTNAGSEKVYIELKVENGQRADVIPSTGVYDYNDGDKLLVGYNNAYVGYLEYNATTNTFSNTLDITQSDEDQPLHFYYLNGQPYTPDTEGKCTVDISNQSAGLPVIAYGTSTSAFASGTTSYSAHLTNYCGLVEFNTTATDEAITITGVNNQMTVNFNGTLTPGNSGSVTLFKPSDNNAKRYAILLPSSTEATVYAYATDYFAAGISIPAISNNVFVHGENAVEVTLAAVDKRFSVSDSKKVYFSPGNLQATCTEADKDGSTQETWTWSFAANQWDYVGNAVANTKVDGNGSVSQAGTVDLFGWSTDNTYYGIHNTWDNATYSGDFKDWGTLAIGSDPAGTWHTLTKDEWTYVLNTRGSTSANPGGRGYRYLKADIKVGSNNYKGLILFPDNYDGSIGSYTTYNNESSGWTSVSAGDWSAMESAGAVFLPAAGWRYGTSLNNIGSYGHYWSSTVSNTNTSQAYYLYFGSVFVRPGPVTNRYSGFSVRLVRNVSNPN